MTLLSSQRVQGQTATSRVHLASCRNRCYALASCVLCTTEHRRQSASICRRLFRIPEPIDRASSRRRDEATLQDIHRIRIVVAPSLQLRPSFAHQRNEVLRRTDKAVHEVPRIVKRLRRVRVRLDALGCLYGQFGISCTSSTKFKKQRQEMSSAAIPICPGDGPVPMPT